MSTSRIRPLPGNRDDAIAELVSFCAGNPVPDMSAQLAERLMTRLVRHPGAVLEVWGDGGRLAVAAVIDTCANLDHSADLALLGQRVPGLDRGAVNALLDAAEQVVRTGPCALLDVTIDAARAPWLPWLRERGFEEAYALFTMERPAALPQVPARAPLAPGLGWQRLDEGLFADYHRVLSAAFASIPGASVAPLEEMIGWLAGSPQRPFVLVGDGRVVAYCHVAVHDTARGKGELRALGRDPLFHGHGLGDHIIRFGLAELARHGVGSMTLSVAARNTAALALYERHGFRTVDRKSIVRRRVAPDAAAR